MRIDVDLTRQDWLTFLRFVSLRMQAHRSRIWLVVIGVSIGVFLALMDLGGIGEWRLDGASFLVAIAIMVAVSWLSMRFPGLSMPVPESWIGPKVYELREDGFHMSADRGTSFVPWSSVRKVVETDDHFFLLLDELSGFAVPKRCLIVGVTVDAFRDTLTRYRATVGPQATATNVAGAASERKPGEFASSSSTRTRVPLLTNLWGGLRLLAFMPLKADHFAPSAREVLLLALSATLIWIGFERFAYEGEVYFAWYGLAELVWLGTVVLALLALLAPVSQGTAVFSRSVTAVAGALPMAALITYFLVRVAGERGSSTWLTVAFASLAALYLYRAKHNAGGEPRAFAALSAFLTVFATLWVYGSTVAVGPELWYSADAGEETASEWAAAEETLFNQPELIDRAVAGLDAGKSGTTELYFVGFAGYGDQSVFAKEAAFARGAIGKRIALDNRALILANSPAPDAGQPLASSTGLKRALRGVAGRMNVDEDILFLYLTSHGSDDATISVSQSMLPLNDLSAADLAQALNDAGIQWRIVVISACYSGSFIPSLRDERTLIVTAARADRTSFGCSEERELTYFGEALFRDALPVSRSLLDAMHRAKEIVTQHEKDGELEPSQPQIEIGRKMRVKLNEIPLSPLS